MRIKDACLILSIAVSLTGCQRTIPSTVYADPFPQPPVVIGKEKNAKPEVKLDDPKYDIWTADPRRSIQLAWQEKQLSNCRLSLRLMVEPSGRLSKLEILKSSGVTEVDNTAMKITRKVFSGDIHALPPAPDAQIFILEIDKDSEVRLARECSKRVGSIK